MPGFLGTIGVLEVAPVWMSMYHYAWFISFGLSAVCYLILMNTWLGVIGDQRRRWPG